MVLLAAYPKGRISIEFFNEKFSIPTTVTNELNDDKT
jgi:hypothetical protein